MVRLVLEGVATAETAALDGPAMVAGVPRQTLVAALRTLEAVIPLAVETTQVMAAAVVADSALQGRTTSSAAEWRSA